MFDLQFHRHSLVLSALLSAFLSCLPALAGNEGADPDLDAEGYHVRPGQSIQKALDLAARNPDQKTVLVHPGVYRPERPGQALVAFHRAHDGVRLRARGRVLLTAANPRLADPGHRAHPAVVNHVVYFGDGVGEGTLFDGFTVTGANDYFSTNGAELVEPNVTLEKGLFFYADGGGIKIFGRSYPVISNVEIVDNFASPCAGGVSVEHTGHGPGTSPRPVVLRNCVIRNNRAQVNGAALDLLLGSYAVATNCLITGNLGNLGFNYVTDPSLPPLFTNSAVVCVFPQARLIAVRCTVAGNRNGIHDMGSQSRYVNCLVADNARPGGFYEPVIPYEVRLDRSALFAGCVVNGRLIDPNQVVSSSRNRLDIPDLNLDPVTFRPNLPELARVGYTPASPNPANPQVPPQVDPPRPLNGQHPSKHDAESEPRQGVD